MASRRRRADLVRNAGGKPTDDVQALGTTELLDSEATLALLVRHVLPQPVENDDRHHQHSEHPGAAPEQ